MTILGDGHGRSLNSLEELWEHKWFGVEVGPIIDAHQQHGDSSQSRDIQNQQSNRDYTQKPPDKPQARPKPNRPPRHQPTTSASQPYRPDTHINLLREPVGLQHVESSTWKDRQQVFIKPSSNKLPQTKNNDNVNATQQNSHQTSPPPPPPNENSEEPPAVASSTAPPPPPFAQDNSTSSSSFSPGSLTIPQPLENIIATIDGGGGLEEEYDEDDDINAAWRWRFTRRWQAEQVRHMHAAAQPEVNEDDDDDDIDDWTVAENLLKHSNGLEGLQLQLGRTISTLEGQMSMDPRSPGLSVLLEESFSMRNQASPLKDEVESGRGEGRWGGGPSSSTLFNHPHHATTTTIATTTTTTNSSSKNGHHHSGRSRKNNSTNKTPEATSAIVAVAKRVEHLLREQAKIEQTVVERLEAAQINSAWVGATLPVVQVDTWGRFAFILASVADKDHHKLLVRGLNGQDEQQTINKLKLEASRAATAAARVGSSLPPVGLHIIGAGMMEWGGISSSSNKIQERRVFINRTQVRAILGKDARVKTDGDVMHVTIDLLNRNLAKNVSVVVGSNPSR